MLRLYIWHWANCDLLHSQKNSRQQIVMVLLLQQVGLIANVKLHFFFEKSVSYQKKGGRGHKHQSFFWYDNDSGH